MNDTTITNATPRISSTPAKDQLNRNVTPVRLDFIDMPGRESHWKVDVRGTTIIPSPTPIFPKPLALQYRNFNEQYAKHAFLSKGIPTYDRAWAGGSLVSSMLQHYFSSSEYVVTQVWPGSHVDGKYFPDEIISGVPTISTLHYGVLRKSELQSASLVVLVVIITEPSFFQETLPDHLQVVSNHLNSRGSLVVNDLRMSRGAVVLLSGTNNPLKPSFEFYNFGTIRSRGTLSPSPVEFDAHGGNSNAKSNALSLAMDDVAKVDGMFKMIVRTSSELPQAPIPGKLLTIPIKDKSVVSKSKSVTKDTTVPPPMVITLDNAETTIPPPKRLKLDPQESMGKTKQTAPASAPLVTEAYVRSVKKDTLGRLYLPGGRHVPATYLVAVRQMAKNIGHEFKGRRE
ncbi:hypothetical protein N0V90_012988 [Kalmusia sp. IMI 367209]|nr:hypothetical protein N0V90_012988 [Kalmusia sp. IMI 367209]